MQNARPTEYKQIVFRSKCEAMFARFLDLSLPQRCNWANLVNIRSSGFIYEPSGFDVGKWRPDFLRWWVDADGPTDKTQKPFLITSLIEYKPKRPTDTYIEELSERFQEIYEERCDIGDFYPTFYLYFGSVYSERGYICFDDTHGCDNDCWGMWEYSEDWLKPYYDDIKNYRFDLQHVN